MSEQPIDPPRVERLAGFARVRTDATLYSSPDAASAVGKVVPPDSRRPDDIGSIVVHVVSSNDPSYVEVRATGSTVVWPYPLCDGPSPTWASQVSVTFFVRRDDVIEALIAPAERRFADGTRVLVGAGAPIRRDGRRTFFDLGPLPVELENAKVGRSFERPGLEIELGKPFTFDESDSLRLEIGGRAMTASDVTGLVGWPRHATREGNRYRIVYTSHCVHIEAFSSHEPKKSTPGNFGMIGLLNSGSVPALGVIPTGSGVFWSNGMRAGTVTSDITLYQPGTIRGYLTCYGTSSDVVLCYETSAHRRM